MVLPAALCCCKAAPRPRCFLAGRRGGRRRPGTRRQQLERAASRASSRWITASRLNTGRANAPRRLRFRGRLHRNARWPPVHLDEEEPLLRRRLPHTRNSDRGAPKNHLPPPRRRQHELRLFVPETLSRCRTNSTSSCAGSRDASRRTGAAALGSSEITPRAEWRPCPDSS